MAYITEHKLQWSLRSLGSSSVTINRIIYIEILSRRQANVLISNTCSAFIFSLSDGPVVSGVMSNYSVC